MHNNLERENPWKHIFTNRLIALLPESFAHAMQGERSQIEIQPGIQLEKRDMPHKEQWYKK